MPTLGGLFGAATMGDTLILPKSKGVHGIRSARDSNIALLGKHIWDCIQNQSKLWVSLLTSKYLAAGSNNLQAVHKPGISCVWRAIFSAFEILKPGFKVRVGKGTVSIWYGWMMTCYVISSLLFILVIRGSC